MPITIAHHPGIHCSAMSKMGDAIRNAVAAIIWARRTGLNALAPRLREPARPDLGAVESMDLMGWVSVLSRAPRHGGSTEKLDGHLPTSAVECCEAGVGAGVGARQ